MAFLKKYGKQLIIIILITTIIVVIGIVLYYKYAFFYKLNNIYVFIKPLNENISTITADSSNKFILKAEVKNKLGEPVPGIPISFNIDNNIGVLNLSNTKTNEFGEILVTYIPPDAITGSTYVSINESESNVREEKIFNDIKITITAKISSKPNILSKLIFSIFNKIKLFASPQNYNKNDIDKVFNNGKEEYKSAKYNFKLIQVPVVLVHGYQSTSDIFSNMSTYLSNLGFDIIPFDYNSLEGVIPGANNLKNFLADQTRIFLEKGIQVKRFDIIAHSMGGVISRFYSVSKDYIEFNNIRKLIFISTPHKGSHLAPIGAQYFNDQGVRDMMPESDLYKKMFPQMINKGLNPNIQTANIIGQFDEVVSIESASLFEWGIDTIIFNLGENKFNVDSLLDGTISQNAIHKVILNNKKVYEKLVFMLTEPLKYPSKIK